MSGWRNAIQGVYNIAKTVVLLQSKKIWARARTHEKPWLVSPMVAPSVRAVATTYASTRARDSFDSWPLLGGVRALAVSRTIVPLCTAVRVTCPRPFCPCVLLCSFLVCEGQAKEGSDLEAFATLAHWNSKLESCHHHARTW